MSAASLFWLVALLLVGITVAALVWPLLRHRARTVESEDVATTDVYRDQKRQLDAEWAAGAITREERDASLTELALRLSAELLNKPSHAATTSSRSSYVAAVVLAAALPVTALALYAAFGNPSALRVTADATNPGAPKSHEEIVAVVETLAKRMKEHPEDPKGWRLLGRAYTAMGRFREAAAAFQEAAKRGGEDASLLADWADALAMQNQSLEGEPSTLIARALALDPNDEKALSLAASAAFYRRDFDVAIAQWRKLQSLYPPASDEAKEVGSFIAEAEAAKRGGVAAGNAPDAAASVAPPSAPTAGAATASTITGNVSLDPKLQGSASPNDTLFIYARAAQGPRMPLAIVRASAKDLPRAFTLDDSMAMTPTNRLSTAANVIVEARISKSGNAIAAPGDLVGTSGVIKPGSRDVSIVINDVVR
jgi:cytochrome c-type biogenesis protein CcmH